MIIWHYCPPRYIMNQHQPNDKNGNNINFIFGQHNNEKENWQDSDEDDDEKEDEYLRGSEIQFWMGHANFDITKEMVHKFDKLDGVEFFRLLTRYCFIISPGMLFNFSDIRKKIESDFCDKLEQEEIVSLLKDKYKTWIVYVNGKGEIDYACSNDVKDERYIEDSAYFKLSMKKNGGQIIEGD